MNMETPQQVIKQIKPVYSADLSNDNQSFAYYVVEEKDGETPYKVYSWGDIKVAEFKTLTFAIKFIYHTHWELATRYFDKK